MRRFATVVALATLFTSLSPATAWARWTTEDRDANVRFNAFLPIGDFGEDVLWLEVTVFTREEAGELIAFIPLDTWSCPSGSVWSRETCTYIDGDSTDGPANLEWSDNGRRARIHGTVSNLSFDLEGQIRGPLDRTRDRYSVDGVRYRSSTTAGVDDRPPRGSYGTWNLSTAPVGSVEIVTSRVQRQVR